jgi:hypothetical protein
MANRSTFPLVDALFDGKLEDRLREWREDEQSHETIARLIRDEKGAGVTLSTVRRWCIDLGIDTVKAAS